MLFRCFEICIGMLFLGMFFSIWQRSFGENLVLVLGLRRIWLDVGADSVVNVVCELLLKFADATCIGISVFFSLFKRVVFAI